MEMQSETDLDESAVEAPRVDAKEFLETIPPNTIVLVSDLAASYGGALRFSCPELRLYCSYEKCDGFRTFRSPSDVYFSEKKWSKVFAEYMCSDCEKTVKLYALLVLMEDHTTARANKIGELPPFGPPTPTRMLRMLGPERQTFLSGRRCEAQGLGIGAFSYYRRVVENQKSAILDQMIRVAERTSANAAVIDELKQAKAENSFSKVVDKLKAALPGSLLLNGQNPLTILHTALSLGLHDHPDDECLMRAHDIRVVLASLVERMAEVLKDEAELNESLSRLMQAKAKKSTS